MNNLIEGLCLSQPENVPLSLKEFSPFEVNVVFMELFW